MTSVERIMEYINLEPETESPDTSKGSVEKWPQSGSIEFINVSLKYEEKVTSMLKSLSFKIKSGEKIGICGRTGAGKSSIISALFRLAYTDGVIKIDSVDISTLPLADLRNSLSIIPQDVVLFSGTIRDNLDPFKECSDDDLWTALGQVRSEEMMYLENKLMVIFIGKLKIYDTRLAKWIRYQCIGYSTKFQRGTTFTDCLSPGYSAEKQDFNIR